MGAKIDMTGWKMWEHGVPESRLTVIGDSGKRGSGGIYWDCICSCGSKTCVAGSLLRNGNTKSCGCLDKEKIIKRNLEQSSIKINDIYNNLLVKEYLGLRYATEKSKKRRSYYLCECLLCGNLIEVTANQLVSGLKKNCDCVHPRSNGETKIKQILEKNNISFENDKTFLEMRKELKRNLRFDFIIYNKDGSVNRFVEFDGKQHKFGMQGGYWSQAEPLEKIQERDKIKNEWCLKNNYILIRIPYTRLERLCLEDIMGDKFIYKGDDS